MAKTALITGASSGIGLELAKLFAADKINLVIVARSADKLELIANELRAKYGIEVRVMVKDLSLPKTPDVIYDDLAHDNVNIDYLVNNAGFGVYGHFVELELQQQLDEIQVNLTSLTHLSKLFGKDMAARGSGKILNIGSSSGFFSGPMMAVYYATKNYVLAFSEALHSELKPFGVTVTCLAPGPVYTNFQARAGRRTNPITQGAKLQAAPVALAGYRAMMKGKRLVIPGLKMKISCQLPRFLPRGWMISLTRKALESK